jgi:hypothetical protein
MEKVKSKWKYNIIVNESSALTKPSSFLFPRSHKEPREEGRQALDAIRLRCRTGTEMSLRPAHTSFFFFEATIVANKQSQQIHASQSSLGHLKSCVPHRSGETVRPHSGNAHLREAPYSCSWMPTGFATGGTGAILHAGQSRQEYSISCAHLTLRHIGSASNLLPKMAANLTAATGEVWRPIPSGTMRMHAMMAKSTNEINAMLAANSHLSIFFWKIASNKANKITLDTGLVWVSCLSMIFSGTASLSGPMSCLRFDWCETSRFAFLDW